MYRHGLDVFHFKPGELAEVMCKICGSACTVSRNAFGPTCFAAAVAGRSTTHDSFECPHSSEAWHQKAGRLAEALEECASPRLAALIRQDLDDVLRENAPAGTGTGKRGSDAEVDAG